MHTGGEYAGLKKHTNAQKNQDPRFLRSDLWSSAPTHPQQSVFFHQPHLTPSPSIHNISTKNGSGAGTDQPQPHHPRAQSQAAQGEVLGVLMPC